MSASLRRFARRIQGIARSLEPRLAVTSSEAALRVLSVVVPATPVDTGRARGNWQTSLNSPANGESGLLDQTGQTALARGRAAVAGKQYGQPIYIVNNAPYIALLNAGSSKQAPANFVEIAIQTALAGIRNVRIIR